MSRCVTCDGPLSGQQARYCSAACKSKAYRLMHPERYLAQAAANRERHREARRAYDRERGRRPEIRRECEVCGGLLGIGARKRYRVCIDCLRARRVERRRTIARLWAEGASLKDIARALDSTSNSVHVEIAHMRKAGYDIPFRHHFAHHG